MLSPLPARPLSHSTIQDLLTKHHTNHSSPACSTPGPTPIAQDPTIMTVDITRCLPAKPAQLSAGWHPEPTYHIKAKGWLNDPCAPGYDATTGTYHMFYQWNPKSVEWVEISWGHFTSRDGVHWKHIGTAPVLEPDMPYDKAGVYTGCMYPTGLKGERDQLTIIYSSVNRIPVTWPAKPYIRDCASLAVATSQDGGMSWQKSPANPILKGEPDGVVVAGWRDPYVGRWLAMDRLRGQKSLYGVMSGSICSEAGDCPTVFLYAIHPRDLTSWKYLGPLIQLQPGFCDSRKWNADFGENWECAQFMSLKQGYQERQFILTSVEGGLKRGRTKTTDDPYIYQSIWMAGTLKRRVEDDAIRMEYDYGGPLDHGSFYAANTYEHPVDKTRILWGWLREDELTLFRRESKGWTGYLSLPRELFMLTIPNVVRAMKTPLDEITSVEVDYDERTGITTLETLGIRPLKSLQTLRKFSPRAWHNIAYQGRSGVTGLTTSSNWELEAVINVLPSHKKIGFHIQHNDDLSQRSTVYFNPFDEQIVLDRWLSNLEDDIKKPRHMGPFTLFTFDMDGVEVMEKLRLRIYGDGDCVEIYANDRFVMSGLAYADSAASSGISCFVDNATPGHIAFESIRIWHNLDRVVIE